MCGPTNQRTLGIQEGGALKRQELKQSVSDRTGMQYKKQMCFISIKACEKKNLEVIQNKKI